MGFEARPISIYIRPGHADTITNEKRKSGKRSLFNTTP
jgi:hypothetical protein